MGAAPAGPPLRGLVLAGGESRRMGRDKAAIVLAGTSLLEAAVRRVAPFVANVKVAVRAAQAADPLRRRFDLLLDPPGLAGPAAALVAAHGDDPEAAWLVVACDMPGLDADTLEALTGARDPARGGTAFRTPGDARPEPLCAIWEPATLARLAAMARDAADTPVSPRAVLASAGPVLLEPARPARLGSVNTPVDLARYLEDPHGHKP